MNSSRIAACLLGAGLALGNFSVAQADDVPKYTIQEVMQALHKGETNVGKSVLKGEGTGADLKKLVEHYTSLPLQDPPQGDKTEWKERTTKLLTAAKNLEAGKAGAAEEFKNAVNCKACHSKHKPD
jgi:hypothetical protein